MNKASISYVLQEDVLLGTDTVAETLLFATRLKNPNFSLDDCIACVDEVLASLRLSHIANSRIGNGVEGGGISGGERKRVAIGVELVSRPSCLVLDEPTSGLDSTSTLAVLEVLRQIADEGCTVIFSIHQPSLKAFLKFDQVCLLSCQGQQLYWGPPQRAVPFFREAMGHDIEGVIPVALRQQLVGPVNSEGSEMQWENPAETLLEVASSCSETLRFVNAFSDSSNSIDVTDVHQKYHCQVLDSWTPFVRATPLMATWLLLKRGTRNIMRAPFLLIGHLGVTAVLAIGLASFAHDLARDFLGVQTRAFMLNFLVLYVSMVATSSMGAVIAERTVFVRERTAHFYPAWCYCVSKVICDLIPLRTLPTILLSFIVYWETGLRDDHVAFGKFFTALLMANFTAASVAFFFSALCRDVGQANLWAAAYTIYSFIFSGMMLTGAGSSSTAARSSSAFFFSWEAMMAAEFATDQEFLFNPKIGGTWFIGGNADGSHGFPEPNQALMDNWHLKNRFGFDMLILAIFITGFTTMTILVMTFRKFSK